MTFKELLDSKGFTAYALSKATGIPISTIQRYSGGGSDPESMELSRAAKIAKALGMSLDEMLEDLREDTTHPDLHEGWNEINKVFDVFVEDGILKRGMRTDARGQRPVYPYRKDGSIYTVIDDMPVDEAMEKWNEISWQ